MNRMQHRGRAPGSPRKGGESSTRASRRLQSREKDALSSRSRSSGQVAERLLDLQGTAGSNRLGAPAGRRQTTPYPPRSTPIDTPGCGFSKPVLYPLSYEGVMPICRDFSSATAGPEYQSCEICGKPAVGRPDAVASSAPRKTNCARTRAREIPPDVVGSPDADGNGVTVANRSVGKPLLMMNIRLGRSPDSSTGLAPLLQEGIVNPARTDLADCRRVLQHRWLQEKPE